MPKKYTTVSIPTPLFKKIQKKIEGTGFTSVSSYVTYILREIVIEEDKEKVKEKLKALGYID